MPPPRSRTPASATQRQGTVRQVISPTASGSAFLDPAKKVREVRTRRARSSGSPDSRTAQVQPQGITGRLTTGRRRISVHCPPPGGQWRRAPKFLSPRAFARGDSRFGGRSRGRRATSAPPAGWLIEMRMLRRGTGAGAAGAQHVRGRRLAAVSVLALAACLVPGTGAATVKLTRRRAGALVWSCRWRSRRVEL